MSKITSEQFEALVREGVPLAAQLDPKAVRLEPGVAHIRIPFKPQFVRPGGTITGPIVMALADIAMYAALMTRLGPVEAAVTTHLSASFMRRPAPAPLTAEARLLKLG
ncbi:MAG TPA: PaaI family thioesterase, partial [Sphingomicrobium sp.]|nr:PaaI family thioesterase [Sphingomicrobium sp.]